MKRRLKIGDDVYLVKDLGFVKTFVVDGKKCGIFYATAKDDCWHEIFFAERQLNKNNLFTDKERAEREAAKYEKRYDQH